MVTLYIIYVWFVVKKQQTYHCQGSKAPQQVWRQKCHNNKMTALVILLGENANKNILYCDSECETVGSHFEYNIHVIIVFMMCIDDSVRC